MISPNSKIWARIPSYWSITLKQDTNISLLSKWAIIIPPGSRQQKFLHGNINNEVLSWGTIIIWSWNWSDIRINSQSDNVTIKISPKFNFYLYSWFEAKILFDKNINYNFKDINKLSQIKCSDVFNYLYQSREISQTDKDTCTWATAWLFSSSQNPKIFTPINWTAYYAWSWKYLFSWNAWPNTKIRFKLDSNVMWSTTTDNSWSYIFRIPDEFKNTNWNTQNHKIIIDNAENNSIFQEIYIKVKQYDVNEDPELIYKNALPIDYENMNKDRYFEEYWESKKVYNKSWQNNKLPQGWTLD